MTDGELLIIPGAEKAVIGVVYRCAQEPFVVYDYEPLVEHFISTGMSDEEAREWISYNVEGGWVGPETPGVLHRGLPGDEDSDLNDKEAA